MGSRLRGNDGVGERRNGGFGTKFSKAGIKLNVTPAKAWVTIGG